ncbi:basic salivary proline-rich protein 3-like [Penaeus indicus]|uniref:basic salivary proline-rich protein 3-like n=1 Tax=Penaeus indicus TaxID=29960 RepID=UPI00300C5F2F
MPFSGLLASAAPVLLTKIGPLGTPILVRGFSEASPAPHPFKKRFGPPPGFPLASSWPSIVHYLSGPNIYALGTRRHIRPPPRRDGRRPFVMASPGPAPPPPPPREGRRAGPAGAGGNPRRPGEESQSLRPGARGRPLLRGIGPITFIAPVGLARPLTRIHVGLLGPCFKTGREEYRLFARREGHAGEGQGSAGASELGSTAASDQSPVPGRPRRSDRRGGKTRAPGDPRTGALENAPRPPSDRRHAPRFLNQDPPPLWPQTPGPNASRRPTVGGKIAPPAPGRRRGAGPPCFGFLRPRSPPEREVVTSAGPSPAGRRTESPQFDPSNFCRPV